MIPKPMFTEDEVARYLELRFGTLYALEFGAWAKKQTERKQAEALQRSVSTGDWWSTVREDKMLSWDEAVKAMKAEGFDWMMKRQTTTKDVSRGWSVDKIVGDGYAESDLEDPTEAINELLAKCRERWPAKTDPWDKMTLQELIDVCLDNDWMPQVNCMGRKDGVPYWVGSIGDGYLNEHYEKKNMKTAADALRSAMKKCKP